jgi:hypothetical protein
MKKHEKVTISTIEGDFKSDYLSFDEPDKITLKSIYDEWVSLNKKIKDLGGRQVNLPDTLSECIFCLHMKCVRVTKVYGKTTSSFDVFNFDKKRRIQVKACSILPDLTSFGPKSKWDDLYFMDFSSKDGNWDGSVRIYYIPNDLIYNQKINKTQTFKEQQALDRRPRFSIYSEIILKKGIVPVLEFKI